MIKKTITYTDFDNNERTEDLYFNLTEAELFEMQFEQDGGLAAVMQKAIAQQKSSKIIEIIRDVIKRSYGVKSLDGKQLIKNDEVYNEFRQSNAYSILYMELATSAEKSAQFINGVIPANLSQKVSEQKAALV